MINYAKCNNNQLIEKLQNYNLFTSVQNYCPIYKEFFILNETNYNNVRFRHNLVVHDVEEFKTDNVANAVLKSSDGQLEFTREVFFKHAPLVDPFRYLIGKYRKYCLTDLPTLSTTTMLDDVHNCSYVEMLFVSLNSILYDKYNFPHGIQFYGSFSGIKRQFNVDVTEDIDYLQGCPYFNKNMNKLFFSNSFEPKCPAIKIEADTILNEICTLENDDVDATLDPVNNLYLLHENDDAYSSPMKTDDEQEEDVDDQSDEQDDDDDQSLDEQEDDDDESDEQEEEEEDGEQEDDEDDMSDSITEDDLEYEDDDYENSQNINSSVIIENFPVQVICMEKFEGTLDFHLTKNDPSEDEYIAILMQIIMILATLQNKLLFTHNDLHTNNIMYHFTDEAYLCYKYNNKFYKVPTYGKIYKIIDFGRAVFQVKGKRFCSNSFKKGNDAATQYNTEPFYDASKKRVDPNYSFDLCRLGCSLLEIHISSDNDIIESLTPKLIDNKVVKIISEWCLDDSQKSVVYTTRCEERYPDFQLYKQIARNVHNHIPSEQLKRDEFNKFQCSALPDEYIIDIDAIPNLF